MQRLLYTPVSRPVYMLFICMFTVYIDISLSHYTGYKYSTALNYHIYNIYNPLCTSENLQSKNIFQNISHVVKEMQKEFKPSNTPAQSDSALVQHFCSCLEAAFIHGLKVRPR